MNSIDNDLADRIFREAADEVFAEVGIYEFYIHNTPVGRTVSFPKEKDSFIYNLKGEAYFKRRIHIECLRLWNIHKEEQQRLEAERMR